MLWWIIVGVIGGWATGKIITSSGYGVYVGVALRQRACSREPRCCRG